MRCRRRRASSSAVRRRSCRRHTRPKPRAYARAIARSSIPLQLWWSRRDSVITDQAAETAVFYRRLVGIAPAAPVQQIVGYWSTHTRCIRDAATAALACFGLVDPAGVNVPAHTSQRIGTVEELPPERGRRRFRSAAPSAVALG